MEIIFTIFLRILIIFRGIGILSLYVGGREVCGCKCVCECLCHMNVGSHRAEL